MAIVTDQKFQNLLSSSENFISSRFVYSEWLALLLNVILS